MKVYKRLYDTAKRNNSEEYWMLTAELNNKLKKAHNNYCSRLFDNLFGSSKRQFRKYIKIKCKHDVGVSVLLLLMENHVLMLKVKLNP